jgi:hypothetical protein
VRVKMYFQANGEGVMEARPLGTHDVYTIQKSTAERQLKGRTIKVFWWQAYRNGESMGDDYYAPIWGDLYERLMRHVNGET